MYYVYVLQSNADKNWFYVGFTAKINQRISKHNSGFVKSTKNKSPLTLVYYEAYRDCVDARKREKHLKTHQQRDLLKERIVNSIQK